MTSNRLEALKEGTTFRVLINCSSLLRAFSASVLNQVIQ